MTSPINIAKKQTEIGEVFTRREIVDHILHEVFYFGQIQSFLEKRVLEPSCGEGAFVVPLVEKVIAEVKDWDDIRLDTFLKACDISKKNIEKTKERTKDLLIESGCNFARAESLVCQWFECDDFLLHEFKEEFDVIVGNPPYIRYDDLSNKQQREYKSLFSTFSERCDIYVPFFEKALSLLSDKGILSFICSNRFTKSSYGKKLRSYITNTYRVALYLNMEHTNPFEEEVSAYPAIYVIDRCRGLKTLAGTISDITKESLLSCQASSGLLSEFDDWYHGEELWISTDSNKRKISDSIIKTYPIVEKSAKGTQIGIGVASGADDIYVDPQKRNDLESECLLPLVTADDINAGVVNWNEHYILNPFDDLNDRRMRDLGKYPKMAGYLNANSTKLKARYCAMKHPTSWYRTLDRISYRILKSPKLLLPDIQNGGNVALDEDGRFYPHHNVYWIISGGWNLRALCVLMRSSFVTDQIRSFSQEMRGGFIRYQAQNLRKVHIPSYDSLTQEDITQLVALYEERNVAKIDATVNTIIQKAAFKQNHTMEQMKLFPDL